MRILPEQHTLQQLLRYDPATGKVFWRRRDGPQSWNTRFADCEAGYGTGKYRYITLLSTVYILHRVIWKLHTGEEPEVIDHINHDSRDNRFDNLRNVDWITNQRNRKYLNRQFGVARNPAGKWTARIKVNHKSLWLGTFCTQAEALHARKLAEQKHGFHETHGCLNSTTEKCNIASAADPVAGE